jgi:hypothetical protein
MQKPDRVEHLTGQLSSQPCLQILDKDGNVYQSQTL